MKKMLIHAGFAETSIALVDISNNELLNIHFDSNNPVTEKNNIYVGIISRIELGLDAVFIKYKENADAFLPSKEIHKDYLPKNTIKDLKIGDKLLIQIIKDSRACKKPYATTFISLAGCYLIYHPYKSGEHGVSLAIPADLRKKIRNTLHTLKVPHGKLVARTASQNFRNELLERDLQYLLQTWSDIITQYSQLNFPFLIAQGSELAVKIIQDYLRPEIIEIIVDDTILYKKLCEVMGRLQPSDCKIRFYKNAKNIFDFYLINDEIDKIYKRIVPLKSGGSLTFDVTEALVAVDVNSAKSILHSSSEDTALHTNLEAVKEVAKQLRFRNLSGIIIIDLIDMQNESNRSLVEQELIQAIQLDSARIHILKISSLGIIEMSRQHLKNPSHVTNAQICKNCTGTGRVMSDYTFIHRIIKSCHDYISKLNCPSSIYVSCPKSIIKIVQQEYSEQFKVDSKYQYKIILQPVNEYQIPQFSITIKEYLDEVFIYDMTSFTKPSYSLGLEFISRWLQKLRNFFSITAETKTYTTNRKIKVLPSASILVEYKSDTSAKNTSTSRTNSQKTIHIQEEDTKKAKPAIAIDKNKKSKKMSLKESSQNKTN